MSAGERFGVPVVLQLRGEVFLALERIAARKGITMRQLIEQHLERGLAPAAVKARPKPGRQRAHVMLTTAQVDELLRLSREGWSLKQLAARYGCSRQTIDNWRRRAREAAAALESKP